MSDEDDAGYLLSAWSFVVSWWRSSAGEASRIAIFWLERSIRRRHGCNLLFLSACRRLVAVPDIGPRTPSETVSA